MIIDNILEKFKKKKFGEIYRLIKLHKFLKFTKRIHFISDWKKICRRQEGEVHKIRSVIILFFS